jgi:hypothetical protein
MPVQMKTTKELLKIYSGPEASARLVKLQLDQIGINAIIKEDSGVFIGVTPSTFDLWIDKHDLDRAKPVIDDFFKNQKKD